jgi:hypothetical protein
LSDLLTWTFPVASRNNDGDVLSFAPSEEIFESCFGQFSF